MIFAFQSSRGYMYFLKLFWMIWCLPLWPFTVLDFSFWKLHDSIRQVIFMSSERTIGAFRLSFVWQHFIIRYNFWTETESLQIWHQGSTN